MKFDRLTSSCATFSGSTSIEFAKICYLGTRPKDILTLFPSRKTSYWAIGISNITFVVFSTISHFGSLTISCSARFFGVFGPFSFATISCSTLIKIKWMITIFVEFVFHLYTYCMVSKQFELNYSDFFEFQIWSQIYQYCLLCVAAMLQEILQDRLDLSYLSQFYIQCIPKKIEDWHYLHKRWNLED